jgi:predicted ATPase
MVIEDLHWIDCASEELLAKIVASEAKLRLLLLMTRRPEYSPSWLDRTLAGERGHLERGAASVIGRQFEPQLLAVVVSSANIYAPLTAMQALDLVHRESKSGDYSFKHALVRDALYQSLLTEGRTAFHLKIAEEIERRSGNRLTEVAEVLAHHYCQTDRAEKAFAYLSMAAGTASDWRHSAPHPSAARGPRVCRSHSRGRWQRKPRAIRSSPRRLPASLASRV